MMIDPYIGQRAQEALKELLSEAPFEARIDAAFKQLVFVTSEHFTKTCPADVEAALGQLRTSREKSTADKVQAIYIAILVILAAFGKQDIALQIEDLSNDLVRTGGNQSRN